MELLDAAAMLGGSSAARRTTRLLDDLVATESLTPSMCRELVALHRLISLDQVSEPDRVEATPFAAIDPLSSIVKGISLLLDGLLAHLTNVAAGSVADEALPKGVWPTA